jgi:hypothetical protein
LLAGENGKRSSAHVYLYTLTAGLQLFTIPLLWRSQNQPARPRLTESAAVHRERERERESTSLLAASPFPMRKVPARETRRGDHRGRSFAKKKVTEMTLQDLSPYYAHVIPFKPFFLASVHRTPRLAISRTANHSAHCLLLTYAPPCHRVRPHQHEIEHELKEANRHGKRSMQNWTGVNLTLHAHTYTNTHTHVRILQMHILQLKDFKGVSRRCQRPMSEVNNAQRF